MKRAKITRGRIEEHAKGVGTVTEEMVEERARELAIARGRRGDQFDRSDLDQARELLESGHNLSAAELPDGEEPTATADGSPPVSTGQSAPVRGASDEQNLVADLVAEGLEEADHEQRVLGNEQSRRRDREFDDQLQSSETEQS